MEQGGVVEEGLQGSANGGSTVRKMMCSRSFKKRSKRRSRESQKSMLLKHTLEVKRGRQGQKVDL